jgi:phytoene/squalene synthetase
MKQLYDEISNQTASLITKKYSTSFSLAVSLLDRSIRQDVYNIYGFVRVADEIVDSFDGYPQEDLFDRFEEEFWISLKIGVSSNPVINAFQNTIVKYDISISLVKAFLKSMRADISKKIYQNKEEIDEYIYGSADVVGLMCLKIFVKGDQARYSKLEASAIKLGSAFQKVNFLRDLRQDFEELDRTYFPNVDPDNFKDSDKDMIVKDIENDFKIAKEGILQLPKESRLGVYLAYKYYSHLLKKIVHTPAKVLKEDRIRVSNMKKIFILLQSYLRHKFNLV